MVGIWMDIIIIEHFEMIGEGRRRDSDSLQEHGLSIHFRTETMPKIHKTRIPQAEFSLKIFRLEREGGGKKLQGF